MDKKERKRITFLIGDLLDTKCKNCEFNNMRKKQGNAPCFSTCETGLKLQELGQVLEGKKPIQEVVKEEKEVAKITKEAYESMKNEGKSDSFIASHFGIKGPTLIYHKNKWYPSETKPVKKSRDVEKELRDLNNELSKRVKELEAIGSRYMEECGELQKENDHLKKQLEQSSAKVSQLETLVNEQADTNDNLVTQCEELEAYIEKLKAKNEKMESRQLEPAETNRELALTKENELLRQTLKVVL